MSFEKPKNIEPRKEAPEIEAVLRRQGYGILAELQRLGIEEPFRENVNTAVNTGRDGRPLLADAF